MAQIGVRFPDHISERINDLSVSFGGNKSAVVKHIVEAYFSREDEKADLSGMIGKLEKLLCSESPTPKEGIVLEVLSDIAGELQEIKKIAWDALRVLLLVGTVDLRTRKEIQERFPQYFK